jgi:RecB family endonuclease NucS
MKIYSKQKQSLQKVKVIPFQLEREIQTLVENNLDELFGYTLIQSEFTLGNFRLDTLCYDKQNNSVVIIEYKKGKNYSVIDQGFSYLSQVLDNKSDIILNIHNRRRRKRIKKIKNSKQN